MRVINIVGAAEDAASFFCSGNKDCYFEYNVL